MTVTFSKQILTKYALPGQGYFTNVKLYKVFDKKSHVGEFLQFQDTCLFNFAGSSMRIQHDSTNLVKSKYLLFDQNNQAKIGEYTIPGFVHQYGTLILVNETYRCQKLQPATTYSLFSKKTWGHYKIQLGNETSAAIYAFKINEPFFSFANQTKYRPFVGEIELYNGNMLLLFAGLFLLDVVLEKSDTSFS